MRISTSPDPYPFSCMKPRLQKLEAQLDPSHEYTPAAFSEVSWPTGGYLLTSGVGGKGGTSGGNSKSAAGDFPEPQLDDIGAFPARRRAGGAEGAHGEMG